MPIDPLLGPLQDNGGPTLTHRPLRGSLAIDHGSNELAFDPDFKTWLINDQRGPNFDRIRSGTVDIGAVEAGVNEAPTDIALSIDSVVENSRGGSVVGTLSVTDPDVGENFGFRLIDSAGGRFEISGSNLVVADGSRLDFEETRAWQVIVRITDSGGNVLDKTLTITLTDVNEAPVASGGSLTTAENVGASGVSSASDVDGDLLRYWLADVTNAHGVVTITNVATGEFRYVPATGFSGTASFSFAANDGSLDSNIGTVTITVTPLPTQDVVYSATGNTVLVASVVGGRLQVRLGTVMQPAVDPALVKTLTFNGAAARDSINLSGLSATLYSHLVGITINGGAGNDSIVGSSFNEAITGGLGNDW